MIILAYAGIGKTTLSKGDIRFVDLDSSLFPKEGEWWHDYVEEAERLSKEGYIVFISTHKKVQERVLDSNEVSAVIYPSLCLHEFWEDKLRDRYLKSHKEEDHRALMRCVQYYCDDITELKSLPNRIKQIVIKDEYYKLEQLLESEGVI